MPNIQAEVCRGVWAALEDGQTPTLDDIETVSGIRAEHSAAYLTLLCEQGYACISGVRRLKSGDAIPLFRLVRRTGPKAPYQDANGRFIDPNVIATQSKGCRWGTFPSLMAKIRVAAEEFILAFTREDLAHAIDTRPHNHEFQKCWWRLKKEGGLQAADGDRYTYELSPAAAAVREFFREHAGQDVRSHEIRVAGRAPVGAALKRHALDLLAAEGYRITIRPARLANEDTIYRADAPDN